MGPSRPTLTRQPPALAASLLLGLLAMGVGGCRHMPFPFQGDINAHADGHVTAGVNGSFDVRVPAAVDPGPVVPVMIRSGANGPQSPRVAVLDVDGLILNQNFTGPASVGENPVAAFREKLEAVACDPRVKAVVLRVNSPGGGVAASDLMAEELKRFRAASGKPVVASLLDVATGGAYYLAVGSDKVLALPTTVTGAIGALVNHSNLQDAMEKLSLFSDPVKAGDLVDMGTVTAPLDDEVVKPLFQEMVNGFRDTFVSRVSQYRPGITKADWDAIKDGRIVAGSKALNLHMVDRLGYPDDAIIEAEKLANAPGAEVVLFQRSGYPVRSIYATIPNVPLQATLFPMSYPGLERSKLPTFLYLWQADPTITRLGGQ